MTALSFFISLPQKKIHDFENTVWKETGPKDLTATLLVRVYSVGSVLSLVRY